jgi:hypothetical protein
MAALVRLLEGCRTSSEHDKTGYPQLATFETIEGILVHRGAAGPVRTRASATVGSAKYGADNCY